MYRWWSHSSSAPGSRSQKRIPSPVEPTTCRAPLRSQKNVVAVEATLKVRARQTAAPLIELDLRDLCADRRVGVGVLVRCGLTLGCLIGLDLRSKVVDLRH